jgi:alkanesulfonate monooxygenase SsuD/methylene tetrahydromethanopterin reductase-like flavin-dependent oxidoreductase (luciferase family)
VSEPFAPGSISLRAYPHDGLDPVAVLEEMRAQAALAVAHGFAGVMTSEHHGGFAGYLPNPLQLAGFLLDAMPTGWAAPCPLLLPLRPPALVAEEIAWLAARHPGRVGLGVAAGALPVDFEIMDTTMDDLAARFAAGLSFVTQSLHGHAPGPLAADPALARCKEHPVPVLSAANSVTAVQRAARAGAGLLFDSLVTPVRVRELVDAYRAEGGDRPCVLVRRAWAGAPPRADFDRQVDVYRGYAPSGASTQWGSDEMITGTDVRARLAEVLAASGCTALNIRIHVPGVAPEAARDQIKRLAEHINEPA